MSSELTSEILEKESILTELKQKRDEILIHKVYLLRDGLCQKEWNKIVEEADRKTSYASFRFARIRVDRDSDTMVKLEDVWRAFSHYQTCNGTKFLRLTKSEVVLYFIKEFSAKANYRGIEIFHTEEDVQEWDKNKALESEIVK